MIVGFLVSVVASPPTSRQPSRLRDQFPALLNQTSSAGRSSRSSPLTGLIALAAGLSPDLPRANLPTYPPPHYAAPTTTLPSLPTPPCAVPIPFFFLLLPT